MTTKINDVEPKKVNPEFIYVCPDTECGVEHYLTYKQVKTPGFMVVCEYCDTVFTPRLVRSISVNFVVDEPPKQTKPKPAPEKPVKDFMKESQDTLIQFGFTKQEAKAMIEEEYKKTGNTSPVQLVKGALDFLGEKSE